MYQLQLGEQPSYYDTFTSAERQELTRRTNTLQAIYDEAQEYGASIDTYRYWQQFQQAMRVNQLPRTPRVTVREVTHDPIVARPSAFAVFVCRVVTFLF